jgi:4-hydroxy-tetrahydrodipicolinate synthase
VLENLTEFYIETGADGLFANCLSSEMFQLTDKERYTVTKTVVDKVAGRIPVITTGSFSDNMEVSSEFIKKLYGTGVEGVVISTSQPCDELASNDTFKIKMEDLMKRTGDIPLGMYECPQPYKRLVPPETLKWLSEFDRFVYHKDTCCDMDLLEKKIKATQGTSLGIYNAHVPTGIASMKLGARGITPIAANMYPELFSYLMKNWDVKERQKEITILNENLDMMDTIIHHNYPFSAKHFLQKRGMDINTTGRIVRMSYSKHDFSKLDMIMKVFHRLSEELNIDILRF